MVAILSEARWDPSDVLICIFFVAKDAEDYFMHLLAICPFYRFWILLLYQMNNWQRFLPLSRFSFDSGGCVLCCAEAFSVGVILFSILVLIS
jgi:hypothetical protein